MTNDIHGINRKKSELSRFIPLDVHITVETDTINPHTGCIEKIDSHIVKVDKRTGRVKKHMTFNTR